jgi:8-oxo-dGTP diphosphatase
VIQVIQDDALSALTDMAKADGIEQLVVGAIIRYEGTVLLLKRPAADFMGGIWELPSGKVEPGETLVDALTREVLEETGLAVTTVRSHMGSFDYQSGSGKQSRQYNFAVDVATPEPVNLTEHEAYVWVPVTHDLPVTEAVKGVLRAFRIEQA